MRGLAISHYRQDELILFDASAALDPLDGGALQQQLQLYEPLVREPLNGGHVLGSRYTADGRRSRGDGDCSRCIGGMDNTAGLTPQVLSAIRHAVSAMMATDIGGDFTHADHVNGKAAMEWLDSLPARPVVVAFTKGEADELLLAIDNSLHDPEEWANYRNNKGAVTRAKSGRDKLISARWGSK
jgi:hypothetical protein